MSDTRFEVEGFIIADELFTMGYTVGSGPYACAGGVCCGRGAYVDLKERDHVLAHAHLVKPVLDETQTHDETRWFETAVVDDPDYPSGKCVGTESPAHRCTLQDKHGRCSLQVAATTAGLHKWALKPRYCIIFPLEVIDNVIRFDARMQGKQPCCSVRPDFAVPLFEACREELVHLLGEQGFQKVRAHYASVYGARASS
jgi:hypothetical protein